MPPVHLQGASAAGVSAGSGAGVPPAASEEQRMPPLPLDLLGAMRAGPSGAAAAAAAAAVLLPLRPALLPPSTSVSVASMQQTWHIFNEESGQYDTHRMW
jgi:hypothetical protein